MSLRGDTPFVIRTWCPLSAMFLMYSRRVILRIKSVQKRLEPSGLCQVFMVALHYKILLVCKQGRANIIEGPVPKNFKSSMI